MKSATLPLRPEKATPVTATTATPATPLSNRAAASILGTMIVLIVTLAVVLVHATWYSSDSMAEGSAYETDGLAQR